MIRYIDETWWTPKILLEKLANHLHGHYSQCYFIHRHPDNVWNNKANLSIVDSMNTGENSQLGTHGFGSLHNLM